MDQTSALFFSVLAMVVASPDNGADRALLNAYLKQSGIEDNLTRTAKYLEKRELSNEARISLGYMAYISKTVIDKKIVFIWRFP